MIAGSLEDRAQQQVTFGIPTDVATSFAAAQGPEMGRAILALYRSARQPALADAGRALENAAARPGLSLLATEDPFVGQTRCGVGRLTGPAPGLRCSTGWDIGGWCRTRRAAPRPSPVSGNHLLDNGSPHTRAGFGAASSASADMNNSSICGLKSARVGALAKLAEPKTRSSTSVSVDAPMDRHRQATPSKRSSSRALWRRLPRNDLRSRRRQGSHPKGRAAADSGAGLVLENLARTTDSGTEAGVARRFEWPSRLARRHRNLVERFDRRRMHSVAAVRSEA